MSDVVASAAKHDSDSDGGEEAGESVARSASIGSGGVDCGGGGVDGGGGAEQEENPRTADDPGQRTSPSRTSGTSGSVSASTATAAEAGTTTTAAPTDPQGYQKTQDVNCPMVVTTASAAACEPPESGSASAARDGLTVAEASVAAATEDDASPDNHGLAAVAPVADANDVPSFTDADAALAAVLATATSIAAATEVAAAAAKATEVAAAAAKATEVAAAAAKATEVATASAKATEVVIPSLPSAASVSSCSSSSNSQSPQQQQAPLIHHVRWVAGPSSALCGGGGGGGRAQASAGRCPVVTQNENGPCPLLSIVNVLLLRGKMSLPEGTDMVSAEHLVEILGEVLIDSVPKDIADDKRLNYERNIDDTILILPKLQTGLDVNVRFTGVRDFEYLNEVIIFDLLDISLYHGWLMDPQIEPTCQAIQNASYNQLVEKIIENKSSPETDKSNDAWICEQFLAETASQLTYHGLCELNVAMKEGELAVFFRNNHFSTIYKHKDELFLLVTDQGFLKEARIVWETLDSTDGAGQFVDENFLTVPPKQDAAAAAAASGRNRPPNRGDSGSENQYLTEEQQIDQDHLIAMALVEEDEKLRAREQEWQNYKSAQLGLGEATHLTDEDLALRLQAEEEHLAAADAAEEASRSGAAAAADPSQSVVMTAAMRNARAAAAAHGARGNDAVGAATSTPASSTSSRGLLPAAGSSSNGSSQRTKGK